MSHPVAERERKRSRLRQERKRVTVYSIDSTAGLAKGFQVLLHQPSAFNKNFSFLLAGRTKGTSVSATRFGSSSNFQVRLSHTARSFLKRMGFSFWAMSSKR